MMAKIRTSMPAAIGLLVLILDTRTALLGASQGLELCIRTVIPSLFPFFVLSILLTSALTGESIPIPRPLGRLCGIVKGGESLLLVGMLGGYPTGAQCVAQAYRDGTLAKQDAQRMIAFCNLAGPAFLFGIVAGKFSNPLAPWVLWLIHILTALLVSVLLPNRSNSAAVLKPSKPLTITDAMVRSLRIIASVCGWIILFRIVITFLDRWMLWLLPTPYQVAITGFLELSNGCCDLGRISSESLRFILAAGMLSFGGVCVTMQTASVTAGLSLKTYLKGKILQSLLSIALAAMIQGSKIQIPVLFWVIIAASIAVSVKFLQEKQKKSSISQLVGV